jgi:hypothetical protein
VELIVQPAAKDAVDDEFKLIAIAAFPHGITSAVAKLMWRYVLHFLISSARD